ncbi:hypothetical protein [Moorena producens]|uniref:hypothetical protein n=1 Tax=Moorena producens TaxID=1155739 RepID=UPI000AA55442|nr:hypothetical protein [Moorena producens]
MYKYSSRTSSPSDLLPITHYPLPITLVLLFGKSDMLPFPTPYSLLPTPYSLLSPRLRIQSIP